MRDRILAWTFKPMFNPLTSWSVQLILGQLEHMTLGSAIRYRELVVNGSKSRNRSNPLVTLRMRRPITGDIWLRKLGTDMDSYREVVSEGVYNVVTDKIRDCKFVIDLGANIGLATRFFATRYPRCQILAVEPHVENFSVMEKNVADLVKAGRCRTVRAAVWDQKSRLALGVPSEGEEHFYGMFVYEPDEDGTEPVDAVTITELIEQSGYPIVDILKVDIEGAEVKLLRGDLRWLDRVRLIAIEFHGDSRKQSDFDTLMERFGFQVDDSNKHTVIAIRRDIS